MKITFGRTAAGTLLLLFVLSSSVLAQQASLRRNVILRRDPSSQMASVTRATGTHTDG